MRTVNIGELRNQLSAYLQHMRNGEEVIVRDRNKAVTRILPIEADSLTDHEAQLVASGAMTLPRKQMDWDAFFAETVAEDVSLETIAEAVEESRAVGETCFLRHQRLGFAPYPASGKPTTRQLGFQDISA